MAHLLSQDASELDLEWIQADPVSLAFTVQGVDWSGVYTAQIRRKALGADSPLLGTLTVVSALNGTDTDFTLSMSQANSASIPVGLWAWDLQQTGGVTRLKGSVKVLNQVTV